MVERSLKGKKSTMRVASTIDSAVKESEMKTLESMCSDDDHDFI